MVIQSNAVVVDDKLSRGHRKRAQTREQLVEAALAMLAANTLGDASILELATAAGVSNGTFYNYFQSKEELVEAVAFSVSEQIARELRDEFVGVDDPAERVVIAARTFMTRSSKDPVFGWALLRLMGSLPRMSETVRQSILLDVREGKKKGRFSVSSEAAALDMILGTLIAGVRSLLEGRESADHIRAIGEISLIGLGMNTKQARAVVNKLFDQPIPS